MAITHKIEDWDEWAELCEHYDLNPHDHSDFIIEENHAGRLVEHCFEYGGERQGEVRDE